jgi:hypothetical protein
VIVDVVAASAVVKATDDDENDEVISARDGWGAIVLWFVELSLEMRILENKLLAVVVMASERF